MSDDDNNPTGRSVTEVLLDRALLGGQPGTHDAALDHLISMGRDRALSALRDHAMAFHETLSPAARAIVDEMADLDVAIDDINGEIDEAAAALNELIEKRRALQERHDVLFAWDETDDMHKPV